MSTTPRFLMPRIDASQASQDVTHNQSLNAIDIFMNFAIASITSPSNSPPGSPTDGITVLVGSSGTGAFSGHNNAIAYYMQGWLFQTPFEGLVVYSKDDDLLYAYNGSSWNVAGGGSSVGNVPVGGVIPWLKSLGSGHTPSLPAQFVECNGQTLSDGASPFNGDVIPNLNGASAGTQRFLRGAATSGGTGGTDTHTHTISAATCSFTLAGSGTTVVTSVASPSGSTGTLPSYYEVVYVLRIK